MVVLVALSALFLLAAAGWGAWLYNDLVGLRNRIRAAWGDVDALLVRRAELVPNLVAAVRGYADHEERTLTAVTEARTRALATGDGPDTAAERADAENALTHGVQGLFAVAEAYPDLKASANFLELQAELARLENDIAHGRRYYNAVVRDYNTQRERFPNLLVAGGFGFHEGTFFELADLADREAPDVSGLREEAETEAVGEDGE